MTGPIPISRPQPVGRAAGVTVGSVERVTPMHVRVGQDTFGPVDAVDTPDGYAIGDRVLVALADGVSRYVVIGKLI